MKIAFIFLLVLVCVTAVSAIVCENENCELQPVPSVPEFTIVGTGMVILGATAFLIRRRK